jgi:probable HAF family extracellular repeat protein
MSAAHAQCAGYTVEVFAGPDCSFFPSFATAWGIAENGAICGAYLDCGEVGHYVIWWPDGSSTEMPPSADGGIPDTPFSINSSGQVAGRMDIGLPGPLDRAFLYSEGVTTNLGTLPGGNDSEAAAISESGIVCGYSSGIGLPLTAFVWQNGQMSALKLPYGTASVARDISHSGLVCGWMGTSSIFDAHAYIHNLSTGTTIDIGKPIPNSSGCEATGVNNTSSACGTCFVPCGDVCFGRQSFIWSSGSSQDLGVLPRFSRTLAQAINDSNVIVGHCDPGTTGFVWRNGKMTALNDLIPPKPKLNITLVWDINNAGQIVGQANINGSSDRVAVRLTPLPSPYGDFNCDATVNVDDLLGVINNWANEKPKGSNALPPADFDHNGIVELDDLMIVIDNWNL